MKTARPFTDMETRMARMWGAQVSLDSAYHPWMNGVHSVLSDRCLPKI